jgi:hypothetical protein
VTVAFDDLAVKYGLEKDDATYFYEFLAHGSPFIEDSVVARKEIAIDRALMSGLVGLYEHRDYDTPLLFELNIRTNRADGDISKPTRIWLWYDWKVDKIKLAGIEPID